MFGNGHFDASSKAPVPIGIQSFSENGISWNLNTIRFGGDWTPQSSAENMTGCLGVLEFRKPIETSVPIGGHDVQLMMYTKSMQLHHQKSKHSLVTERYS